MNNDFTNIVQTPYGAQVQFIDSRYYTTDGEHWFPGITTILGTISKGKQYETWLKASGFNADVLMRDAMEQGSHVHAAIQDLLNGNEVSFGEIGKPNYSRNEWMMISRFIDFYTEFKPKTVRFKKGEVEINGVEQVLVSDKLGFGTQLDYICELNGELYYIDHKTGSLYDTAYRQIAASIKLWNEYFPERMIKKGAVLHLDSTHRGRDKTGKKMQGVGWQLVEVEDLPRHWRYFQHALEIWKDENQNYRPFNVTYPAKYRL